MIVREIFAKTILSKSAIQDYALNFCRSAGERLRAAFERAGIPCRML